MQVHYSSSGRASYRCSNGRRQRDRAANGTSSKCFSFSADALEYQLSEQILHVVSPAGIQAAELAAARMGAERDARRTMLVGHLEQARYEANLSRRRLDNVDPAKRLVFDTLTAEWELGLQAVEDAQSALQEFDRNDPPRPSVEERKRLEAMGVRLHELWYASEADGRLKQQVARLLIDHVYADCDEDDAVLWIKWSGGHHTELRSSRRKTSTRKTADLPALLEQLRKILDDESISRALNRAGITTTSGRTWTKRGISEARRRLGIAAFDSRQKEAQGWLSQAEAATYLKISPMSVNRLIQQQILPADGPPRLPQVLRRADLESSTIQEAVKRIRSHGNAPLPKNPNQRTLFP
jgi:hypothetical protein